MSKNKSKSPAENQHRRSQSVPVIRGNVWEPLSRLRSTSAACNLAESCDSGFRISAVGAVQWISALQPLA